jgi:hypothetical protein
MRSREFLSTVSLHPFLRLVEDPALKQQIIDVVKSTNDPQVLTKVLKVLKAGNIEERITSVLGQEADAKPFLAKIARAIMEIDAPIEEKDEFLEKIRLGNAINTDALLDGDLRTFTDIVGSGFGLALFKQLSVELTPQGVGPGELALAILSPNIAWSGRVKGGGDIIINKQAVEVKTRNKEGGRWINPRKAGLDLPSIVRAIQHALKKSGSSEELSGYIGLPVWVNTIRPQIKDQNLLTHTAKAIADGTFPHADNDEYQKALISGNETDIKMAIVKVGYNNYKKYSGFAGMLLMDIPTEQVQYLQLYKVGTVMTMAVEQMTNRMQALNTEAGSPIGAFNLKFTRLTTPSARDMVDAINGTHVYSNMPQLPTTASSSWTRIYGLMCCMY